MINVTLLQRSNVFERIFEQEMITKCRKKQIALFNEVIYFNISKKSNRKAILKSFTFNFIKIADMVILSKEKLENLIMDFFNNKWKG